MIIDGSDGDATPDVGHDEPENPPEPRSPLSEAIIETIALLGTTDAMVWATRFVETFGGETVNVEGSQYDGGIDLGTMVVWFANAIEVGRNAGAGQQEPERQHEPILTGPPVEDLESAIARAVGASSVCWTAMDGTGVFWSERAVAIVAELLAWIEERYTPNTSTEG